MGLTSAFENNTGVIPFCTYIKYHNVRPDPATAPPKSDPIIIPCLTPPQAVSYLSGAAEKGKGRLYLYQTPDSYSHKPDLFILQLKIAKTKEGGLPYDIQDI